MIQYNNFEGVMEARNHFKNGASSKSHMSRRNFRFFYLFLIIAGFATQLKMQAQSIDVDGINYYLNTTTFEATVAMKSFSVHGSEYSGDIIIPSSITYQDVDYTVTEIGGSAFANRPNLNSVVMPNTVKVIGSCAFEDCQNYSALKSVTLSNTLEIIGANAFHGCRALKFLELPNSLIRIETEAFTACEFSSITIPSSVTDIGYYIFRFAEIGSISVAVDNPFFSSKDNVIYNKDYTTLVTCPNKTGAFVIPNTVKKIEDYAFAFCTFLSSITIPESVELIGDFAFRQTYLNHLYLNDKNNNFTTVDGILYDKDITTLILCPMGNRVNGSIIIPNSVKRIKGASFNNSSIQSIIIPNTVTAIEDFTFYNSEFLRSVSLPNSLKSIGHNALDKCNALTEILSNNPIPPEIGRYNFDFISVRELGKLFVPKGSKTAYTLADGWNEFKNIIEMQETSADRITQNVISIHSTRNGIEIESNEMITVAIYSIPGQKIYESNIQGKIQINLNKGIYIVNVGKTVQKIIVN